MSVKGIYEEISSRTKGDIYIGVVGPVRTGKSTFIKSFMENMVIDNIENVYKRERARDELPQSGSGRTIMTAEPKFVPEEAAEIRMEDGGQCKIRLVDCVGYMVDGALGSMEGEEPRMVSTPWNDQPISMEQAAEIGTKKVINEHSTIGLVITTDGSVTDIERGSYIDAEDRVIRELQQIGKPFMVLVNSSDPDGDRAQRVAGQIKEKYNVSVQTVNCQKLDKGDISQIIKSVLYEFPVGEIDIILPKWVSTLPNGHKLKSTVYSGIKSVALDISKMRDIREKLEDFQNVEYISTVKVDKMGLGNGVAIVQLDIPSSVFYEIAGEETGLVIKDEADLIPILRDLARAKENFSRFEGALNQVRQTGYGIVMPTLEELSLDEPQIIKQGGRYGVKLSAEAPSIHLVRANIQTEVTPIVGTEKQSEELVHYLLSEFDGEPGKIWESNIFGKSLNELVSEGLNNKINRMPEDAREKIGETLEKIINEGSGGLICIIL